MNQIKKYLDNNLISYRDFHHDEVGNPILYSEKIGTKLSEQAKALLLRCKGNNEKFFVVVSLPADKRVNFEAINLKLGNLKSIRIAEENDMKQLTGCSYGELPPLAKLWGLKLLFSKDLLNEKEIYFNAGRLDYSIALNPKEIVKLEEPIIF